MSRLTKAILLLLLWLSSLPAVADLANLLAWQRQGDSGAYVSSGFHDWRGLSKYRSRPGIHAGYDIAMLAGSSVRTPWPGTVVAITPWYGAEYGVTVRLPNGWEATFGHISPSVSLGRVLQRGDRLGDVVVDHVDVKIQDAGGYVDFGVHKVRLAGLPSPPVSVTQSSPPQLPAAQKQAAADAYLQYSAAVAALAEEEAQIRLGLLPPKAAQQRRSQLERLRPLARMHTELTGTSLPKKAGATELGEDTGRPVADFLLDLPEEKKPEGSFNP